VNNVGEPCAGEPHARFDGRALETARRPKAAAHTRRETTGGRLWTCRPDTATAPAPYPTNLPGATEVGYVGTACFGDPEAVESEQTGKGVGVATVVFGGGEQVGALVAVHHGCGRP
jgi:hypothetical protein